MNDKFPEIHDTTIEDQYKINTNVNGTECSVEILDTAGQEDYQSMMESWVAFANGFILVFCIDDADSYKVVKDRLEVIIQEKRQGKVPPILVLGNKADLQIDRAVQYEEAYSYCKGKGIEYLECSALTKHNVKEAFFKLFEKMINGKKVLSSAPSSGSSSSKEQKESEPKKCFCF
mmetsp:Transcript_21095/g.21873  ORF Transcript_21095/g.21873 Transcript_21095/m.21873 type:complete len:175 (+) Transcript_21095:209-733(+)